MADKSNLKDTLNKFLTFFKPGEVDVVNDKFVDFVDVPSDNPDVEVYSVIDTAMEEEQYKNMGYDSSNSYKNLVYGKIPYDKPKRVRYYRTMSFFPEVGMAIDEICDGTINYDENGRIININTKDDNLTDDQNDALTKEFEEFVSIYDLENEGWEYFRDIVIDGEVCFENLMDKDKPELGIVGVKRIPSESFEYLIDVNMNIVGILVNAQLIYAKHADINQIDVKNSINSVNGLQNVDLRNQFGQRGKSSIIPFPINQITLANTGQYSIDKTIVYPVLELARRAYRQLSLIEDAIIIYRLIRAPERLVFNVDTGGLPPAKAEEMVLKLMKRYQTKKVYDPTSGTVVNDYDPHQMLECLGLDTKIPLLDGRTLTLSEIIDEYNEGKELWTYSCSPITGKILPGKISWAGITRKNAEIIELTLDNGKTIKVTPDHKFPVWGRSATQAKDLKLGDSLISFNTKEEKIGNNKQSKKYLQVFDHESNDWEFVHRKVANTTDCETMVYNENNCDSTYNVIHHKNYDRYNNDPSNLSKMNRKDHWKMHSENMKERWLNNKFREDTIKASKEYWSVDENRSKVAHKKSHKYSINLCNILIIEMRLNNLYLLEEVVDYINNNDSYTMKGYKYLHLRNDNYEYITKSIQPRYLMDLVKHCGFKDFRNFRNHVHPNLFEKVQSRSRTYSHDMLSSLVDIIRNTGLSKSIDIVDYINNNECDLMNKFREVNKGYKPIKKFSRKHITGLMKYCGYTGFKEFKKTIDLHNHRIVNIKYLTEREDTGTLTIDQQHEIHDYHTFALECGVYTYNSYWFPKVEGSAGTTVNSLQSGQSLGNLEDLNYFLKKLYNSLKIPYNRFSDTPIPVEKSDTISYEEYRFSKFINRLQDQFAKGIFSSFVTHLKLNGIWEKFKLNKRSFTINFVRPTSFDLFEQQRLLNLRMDNFNRATEHEMFSKDQAAKKYLGMSDGDLEANYKALEAEMIRVAYLNRKVDSVAEYGTPYGSDITAVVSGGEDEGFEGDDIGGDIGGDVGGAEPEVSAEPVNAETPETTPETAPEPEGEF